VDEAGAAAVDGAGEEGHADGFLVGYALEGADEVGAFQVLWGGLVVVRGGNRLTYLGLVRPLVAELVEHVNVAKGAEDATHES